MAGALRVLSPEDLNEMEASENAALSGDTDNPDAVSDLSKHIRDQYEYFRWHRAKHNLHNRYLHNIRTYNGNYSPDKLAEIKKFGGSEVFARLTTVKCRGATALLRDVYLSGEKPWSMEPTPVPSTPDDVLDQVNQLVSMEAQSMAEMGQPVESSQMQERYDQLRKEANRATLKRTQEAAFEAEKEVDDIIIEGRFYDAFSEFLTDIAIFPFACLKGPIVRNTTSLKWEAGVLSEKTVPKMFWERVSPFDLYFTPGAGHIKDADVIERIKLTRKDITALIGLPGYDEEAIRNVLTDYEHGHQEYLDEAESERADEENKENPYLNRSGLIDTLSYHGSVKGAWLLDYGFTEKQIDDADKDYYVNAWLIGRYTIKVQINPNPNKRHPYYITSFEKVPGSIYGNALPETLTDMQDIANATLRSMSNNMSIASGPQVMINEDRLSPTCNSDVLYPWKRWRYTDDPYSTGQGQPPITFFQPNSNAQELLTIYKEVTLMADEISAIPRYITGSNQSTGGAASTASGLSQLMNNASKVLQNVAAYIDNDVIKPCLEDLYMMVMLTDTTGKMRGDEQIVVKGVTVAAQKETERMRRLEFLNMTMNPMDSEIVGMDGRAALLRAVSKDLALPHEQIVPSAEQLKASREQAQQAAEVEQAAMEAKQKQGLDAEAAGGPRTQLNNSEKSQNPSDAQARLGAETDNMHRVTQPAHPSFAQ